MSNFSDSTPGIRWYIAHTYAGYENRVKANLEKIIDNRGLHDVIVDVKIPVRKTVMEISEDVPASYEDGEGTETDSEEKAAPNVVEEKLFPCYVFVKMEMNDETWHVVRNIRGVTGFVGPGSRPVPLSDDEVAAIGELEETTKFELSFSVGDSVKIVSGFLKGFSGIVQEISEDKKKIIVMASMFGRDTPVELGSDEVTKD